MKRFFKLLFKVSILLCIAVVGFYFWASSPTLEEASYSQLIQNKYAAQIDNDSVFSIVTYNIGYLSGMTNNKAIAKPKSLFDANLETVVTQIKTENPDIIALQEIDYAAARSYYVNQEEEISKLGYTYVARGINWDEHYLPFPYWPPSMHFGKVVSGQSIISKYPLKNYERIVLERVGDNPFYRDAFYLDRLLQIVRVELNGTEVVLMNVHLEAFDKATRVRQLTKVIELFKEYSQKGPTILLGDFNSDPNYKDAAIKKVFELPGIGSAAYSKAAYDLTYDSAKPFERLDYIFYTENSIEYVSGKVLKNFAQASDHLPVEMRFRLR